jgi:putative aminopeptidase FrvX
MSNAPGAPGFEDEVLEALRAEGEGLGEWKEDAMRNLYLRRKGQKEGLPSLMLDAHTDEVGFMIKAVRANGVMDFIALGGWANYTIPAHRVLVRNCKGEWIPGITASKPPHFISEQEKKQAPEIDSMAIDVGSSSAQETREVFEIYPGAPVVPDVAFEYREENDLMIGKAFDDRLGSAAVISALKELSGLSLGVNITGSFSAQEEMGMRGASAAAQTVKPDIAIVFEGTPADDTVVEQYAVQTAIKKGPMLRIIDQRMITNPRFQKFAVNTAWENNIPCQEAVRSGGATNGGVIHITEKAVPVIVIGIPVRYIHTHYCFASYCDYENAVKLACEVIKGINEKTINSF